MAIIPTVETILKRGYFPRELPPPFNTYDFGALFSNPQQAPSFMTKHNSRTSRPEIFNLARAGNLRRELAILNPVHYAELTKFVVHNWTALIALTTSEYSLTTPTPTVDGRAISRGTSLDSRPLRRASIRSHGTFCLFADVARFYPSIYTHSISWAVHTKAVAKNAFRANPKTKLMGDRLDDLLRNCQDAQSVGLPVGPDVSLLLAEIILNRIDQVLNTKGIKGIRYIDDYELVFETQQEALEAKAILQSSLLEFELDLNSSKTRIVTLPQELEDSWVGTLRRNKIQHRPNNQHRQILRFFDLAFELSKKHPNEGVLKYAAGKVAKIHVINDTDKDLVEDLLIQCARVEPGALPFVLATILKRPERNKDLRSKMLMRIISESALQHHSSEVAWAVWACLVLKIPISSIATKNIVSMNDSICALLVLHAKEKKLVEDPKDLAPLRKDLDGTALYGPRWLLAYEAVRKGWFRFTGTNDYIAADPNFSLLRNADVSFYDKTKAMLPEVDNYTENERDDLIDDYVSQITDDDYEEEDDYEEDDYEEEDDDHEDEDYDDPNQTFLPTFDTENPFTEI